MEDPRHRMGDKMNVKERLKVRWLAVAAVVAGFGVFVQMSYTKVGEFAEMTVVNYHKYEPKTKIEKETDTTDLPPAEGVPILMYHGIVREVDNDNTNLEVFVDHLEMLKREGFETISVAEFDEWRRGQFNLPKRPIIITFDDGRKDSYYPTDDILKKLGFKATMFVATGKALRGDRFFLSWEELKRMRDSGRWEIEAHGRDAHDHVNGDDGGGRYLTSRIKKNDGSLESENEYELRVELDYVNGIEDLKRHVGVEARYFAIPLNEYYKKEASNYPKATEVNDRMVNKYFKLAFIQTVVGPEIISDHEEIYNYPDVDPYRVARVEPKNMTTEDLRGLLVWEGSKAARLDAIGPKFAETGIKGYGDMVIGERGLELETMGGEQTAIAELGSGRWDNYAVEARMRRVRGRSVVLLAYMSDYENYVAFGITDKGLFLREKIDGKERNVKPALVIEEIGDGTNSYKLVFGQGEVSAYFNEKIVFRKAKIILERGKVGFKIWDDMGAGKGILEMVKVAPYEEL